VGILEDPSQRLRQGAPNRRDRATEHGLLRIQPTGVREGPKPEEAPPKTNQAIPEPGAPADCDVEDARSANDAAAHGNIAARCRSRGVLITGVRRERFGQSSLDFAVVMYCDRGGMNVVQAEPFGYLRNGTSFDDPQRVPVCTCPNLANRQAFLTSTQHRPGLGVKVGNRNDRPLHGEHRRSGRCSEWRRPAEQNLSAPTAVGAGGDGVLSKRVKGPRRDGTVSEQRARQTLQHGSRLGAHDASGRIAPHGMVGGVQLPSVRPAESHAGTGCAVTFKNSPVERISSATFDATAAEIFGARVNESVSVPPDPLGMQGALRVWNAVRYRSPAAEPPGFSTTTICSGCPEVCAPAIA
jgi:hypothetical protein